MKEIVAFNSKEETPEEPIEIKYKYKYRKFIVPTNSNFEWIVIKDNLESIIAKSLKGYYSKFRTILINRNAMYFNIMLPEKLKIYEKAFSIKITFFNNFIPNIKYEMIIDPSKGIKHGDDNHNDDEEEDQGNKNLHKPIDTIKINYLDYKINREGKVGTMYWSQKNNTLLYAKNLPSPREPISLILFRNKDDINGVIIPNSDLWKELWKNMAVPINCMPVQNNRYKSIHGVGVRPRLGLATKKMQSKRKKKEVINACKKPL